MTLIGYAKPQAFNALEAFDTITRLRVNKVVLSSSKLLPTSRFSTHSHWLDNTNAFLGFFPLSAVTSGHDRQASGPTASRSQVFSTSQQDIVHLACEFVPPHRHSQGLDLQSFTLDRSITVPSHLTPTSLLFLHGILPEVTSSSHYLAAELTFNPTMAFSGPLLQAAGSHHEIQSNLEVLLPVHSVSYVVRFHSSVAITALLTFCSSGSQASTALDKSFLFQGLMPS